MERIQGNCRLSADGCHARRSARPARVLLSQFSGWCIVVSTRPPDGCCCWACAAWTSAMGRCLPGCPRTPGRISWPAGRRPSAPCSPTRLPGLARRLRAVPDAAALAGGHLRRHAVRACGSRDRRAGRRDARAGRRTGVERATCSSTACCACRIPNWTCRWTRSGRMTRGGGWSVHRPAGRAPDGHAFGLRAPRDHAALAASQTGAASRPARPADSRVA